MNANQTNSIGINKWSNGMEIEKAWESGESDNQMIGWVRADGARAIETNGDPTFESEDGFETVWEANA